MVHADREERLHAQLHADGLCDCVRRRFGPRGGRERMLRWKREEAEEEAWLRKEKLRKKEKEMPGREGERERGDVEKAEAGARRAARRAEYLRLKKQRKRRRAMKKKMREVKTKASQDRAVSGGGPETRVPFRCSLQAHLTRRIHDAYSLIDENLGTGPYFTAGATAGVSSKQNAGEAALHLAEDAACLGGAVAAGSSPAAQTIMARTQTRSRRMSTVLRQSHWI